MFLRIMSNIFWEYFKTLYKHPDQSDDSMILPDRDVPLVGATSEGDAHSRVGKEN